MAKKGFVHVDPKKIEKILRDEGGAAGMDPFLKEFGEEMKDEIVKALDAMPNVGQHEDGDYILSDDKEVDIVKESESYSVTPDFMKRYLRTRGYKDLAGKDIEQLYTQSLFTRKLRGPNADDLKKMKNLKEVKNCGCGQNPCKTYGRQ